MLTTIHNWKPKTIGECRREVFQAIWMLRRNGIWTWNDVNGIIVDLVSDVVPNITEEKLLIDTWTRKQCWTFIARGFLSGIIDNIQYDKSQKVKKEKPFYVEYFYRFRYDWTKWKITKNEKLKGDTRFGCIQLR